jgi:hypothetical protein
MHKEFKMTEEQRDIIMDACRPVPLIAINCGMPPSQQTMANYAWERLGKELGFKYMTVRPIHGLNDYYFTAELLD